MIVYLALFSSLLISKGRLSYDHDYYLNCVRTFPHCELHPGYILPLAALNVLLPQLLEPAFNMYQVVGFALLLIALYKRGISIPAYMCYLSFRAHAHLPAYTLALATFLLSPKIAPFFHTSFTVISIDASSGKRDRLVALALALAGALPNILLEGRGGGTEVAPLVEGGRFWVRSLYSLALSALLLLALRGMRKESREFLSLALFFSFLFSPIDIARVLSLLLLASLVNRNVELLMSFLSPASLIVDLLLHPLFPFIEPLYRFYR